VDGINVAREEQRARADRSRAGFYASHKADIERWRLERDDQAFVRQITLDKWCMPALLSNREVRRQFAYAFIDALLADYERYPDRERVWITIAWDRPLTWERAPNLDIKSVRNIAYQHLRRSEIDGIGTLEIDTWKEIAGEPGKRMVPHVHFLGWSKNGQAIDVAALQKQMCSRRALPNSLGAPSVVVKKVDQTARDMAMLGYYMSKPPAYAKNPVPNPIRGGHDLCQVKHAPGSVTRLIEVLSFLEIGDVLFSIRTGTPIAKEIRNRVKARCSRRRTVGRPLTRDIIARHWRRIRSINGNKKFQDCNVITRVEQRRLSELDD
jgi:hypothetical protein